MNRREAGRALLMGALATGVPAVAFAQPGERAMRPGDRPMGPAERRHAMDTARVGGLALRSSQVAQSKARTRGVRQFADFEVAEQTTIAQILSEVTGMAPPPPDEMAMRAMARLNATNGRPFEAAYITVQTDGHQQLLDIQERYLAQGRDPHMRHVAMLARGQIKEHLALLADLRTGRR